MDDKEPSPMQPIHSSDDLIARAIAIAKKDRPKTIAVAAAQDADVIGAVAQAQSDGFLKGVLSGDAAEISRLADEHQIDISQLEVIDEPIVAKAAHAAVALASQGKADGVMKGFLPTSALLKVVLDKQYGLRGENALSHCAVLDIPGYHKLLNFTDGGMVIKPSSEQKMQILENALTVARALGLKPVKVAVSAASDHVSPHMPHTIADVDNILPQVRTRHPDVIIQGPLPLELATSKTVAERSHSSGEVLGDADVFLVDSIEEGNIVAKSLIQFANAVFAGVIVGARVPVSLVSRTDTIKNKKASLALSCVIADYYEKHDVWDDQALRKGSSE
ncbi:phosphate butyryltransferase [candidate division GN15 bacterium]|nr:phosphate butyryltransferase [candidate division GN15 bacterium]